MKQPTKQELIADRASLWAENSALTIALSDIAGGIKPDATATRVIEGERWVLKLYRATGAGGGYVILTVFIKGQRPSTRLQSLDQLYRDHQVDVLNSELLRFFRDAAHQFWIVRQRLCDEKVAAREAGYIARGETVDG